MQSCCNDNLTLGTRRWPGDLLQNGLKPGEALFFVVLLGLLTTNFAKVYVDLREAIFWLPEKLALALGWSASGFYPLAVAWIALIFPLLLLLPGLLVYLLGQVQYATLGAEPAAAPREATRPTFSPRDFMLLIGRLALPLLPLVLAAHLVLAVVKLNAKLAYLPLTLQDPSGVKSFLAINVMQTVAPPGALLSLDLLKWIVAALLLVGLALSLWAARLIASHGSQVRGQTDRPYFAAVLLTLAILTAFYLPTVIQWLFVR